MKALIITEIEIPGEKNYETFISGKYAELNKYINLILDAQDDVVRDVDIKLRQIAITDPEKLEEQAFRDLWDEIDTLTREPA